MTKRNFIQRSLDNGLSVLIEPMQGVSSVSMYLHIPGGLSQEAEGQLGVASITSEMLAKGSGEYSSRVFSEKCEEIGLSKYAGCGMDAVTVSASVLGEQVPTALELLSLFALSPSLPEQELDPVRSLALQDLDALEDEPASKVMEVLNDSFYPAPFNRSTLGKRKDIELLSSQHVRDFYTRTFLPGGAVLGIAGSVDAESVFSDVEKLFSKWKGSNPKVSVPAFASENRSVFEKKDSAQVQIALAYPSAGLNDPHYYNARVGVNVLSGGMSGRLFIEVREKRGLVYRVGAHHSGARDRSAIIAYAGTTPENAEETLSVMIDQLKSLGQGVSEEELHRAKVDLKTRLVMQGESTSGRAASLASDWWHLGRVRSFDEIKNSIDAVTSESITQFYNAYPFQRVCLASLGSNELSLEV